MAIISPGIGTGIDVNSLVSQLVELHKGPQLQRLDVRETQLQARLSGLGALKGALSSLQSALTPLRNFGAFQARTASVSDASVLGASAGPLVTPGIYDIGFSGLAREQRLTTDSALENARFTSVDDIVGTGTLTFTFGQSTGYDPETHAYGSFAADPEREIHGIAITDGSLGGIRDAINAADIGVAASIVFDGAHYRLALTGLETGENNGFEITVADDDGSNDDAAGLSLLAFNAGANHLQQTQGARNVVDLVVNGIAISSGSNTLTEVINGLTINLAAPGTAAVTVARDHDAVTGAVKGFVEQFNGLITMIGQLSSYDPETRQAGILNGDRVLSSVDLQVRRILNQPAGDQNDPFRYLADIGVTRALDGTLALDEARLQSAMNQDFDAIAGLFRDGGYADGLDGVISELLNGGGLFDSVTQGINRTIRDIDVQREQVELRAITYEERIRVQFTAMDALVAQLRSTSDFLMQQLDNLPRIGQNRSSGS